uniref:Synaptogyrin 2b n=1 Tax=Cyprinus carpio carpio TaxID=630221 RepID=A0A9J8DGB8_CYPCA
MESNSAVYGVSLAGAGFDLIKFIKQPQTIIRFLSWVFAIVVFASITAEGYVNSSSEDQVKCVFNRNDGACHYGVGIGVIAFLACIAFLLADVFLPSMSNAQERKYVVMADLGFSGSVKLLRSGEVSSWCCRRDPELRRSAGGPHLTISHHLHAAHISILPEHRSRHLPAAALRTKP